MAEYIVKKKTFTVSAVDPEAGTKANVLIAYTLSNGVDEQIVFEEILDVAEGSISGAQLTTREAAVLLAANS